jgi:hypothetical protein
VFHSIVAKLKECVQWVICSIKCNRVQTVLTNCESHSSEASWQSCTMNGFLLLHCFVQCLCCCFQVLLYGGVGQNSEKNMLTCILYVVSAAGMVGLMWWNTGNNIRLTEFHISRDLRMYPDLWWKLILSYKQMQKVNNSGIEKVNWQHSSEAQVQEYTAFPGSLVYHRHQIGELYTMILSIRITLEVCNTYR